MVTTLIKKRSIAVPGNFIVQRSSVLERVKEKAMDQKKSRNNQVSS